MLRPELRPGQPPAFASGLVACQPAIRAVAVAQRDRAIEMRTNAGALLARARGSTSVVVRRRRDGI